jgi:hypothetical protein
LIIFLVGFEGLEFLGVLEALEALGVFESLEESEEGTAEGEAVFTIRGIIYHNLDNNFSKDFF